MKLFSPARLGALTILICSLFWAAFLGPTEAKPVPVSVQSTSSPKHVDGVLISLHGGGWVGDRDLIEIRQKMRPFVQPALTEGWTVMHVAYSSGASQALADINRVYRKVRRKYHNSVPVCLMGNSAGGHLALTYAGITAKRRDIAPVSCVVASSPPTNIRALRRDAVDKSPARKRNLARFLEVGFRGPRQMARLSPVRYLPWYRSKTLLFTVHGDPVVSPSQIVSFSARLRRHRPRLLNKRFVLRGGVLPFVHHGVSLGGWITYRERVRRFLRNA